MHAFHIWGKALNEHNPSTVLTKLKRWCYGWFCPTDGVLNLKGHTIPTSASTKRSRTSQSLNWNKSNIHCDWLDLYLLAWVADRQDSQYAHSSSSEQWFVEMMHSEDLYIVWIIRLETLLLPLCCATWMLIVAHGGHWWFYLSCHSHKKEIGSKMSKAFCL